MEQVLRAAPKKCVGWTKTTSGPLPSPSLIPQKTCGVLREGKEKKSHPRVLYEGIGVRFWPNPKTTRNNLGETKTITLNQ